MTSADQSTRPGRAGARRPASGVAIDPAYLEHLRNMRKLSRARLAELVGQELFDRDRFDGILAGAEPLDARTLRVLARVLGCEDPGDLVSGRAVPGQPGARWLDREALRALLAERDWTADDLAARVARAGRSRDNVAKWENGERKPKQDALGALCAILGCAPGELMTGEPPRAAREAVARQAREDYYAGLREFADGEGIAYADGNGELSFPAELRREYDRFLLSGGSRLAS